jgi:hypothetical protein
LIPSHNQECSSLSLPDRYEREAISDIASAIHVLTLAREGGLTISDFSAHHNGIAVKGRKSEFGIPPFKVTFENDSNIITSMPHFGRSDMGKKAPGGANSNGFK